MTRVKDLIDVWFDSGVSLACVFEEREYLGPVPVDMYLEGSDQHRGWFHSSLLCAVGTRGYAPYKTVLTHGYTVDAQGKKYSKSSGNYIPLDDLLKDYGAEVLRMWTASENFRNDIRVSREIMDGIGQVYRKVRNTIRYMLGNLDGFDPRHHRVPVADMLPLDRWMLSRVEKFKRRALEAYQNCEFHLIYHGLNQLCTVDLSALYFDLVRDRLYCEALDSPARRSAQSAVWLALDALVRLMAPVLSFTAEEVRDHMPGTDPAVKSVHCLSFPGPCEEWELEEEQEKLFDAILQFQWLVNQDIDKAQKNKAIGHPNDAQLIIAYDDGREEYLVLERGLGEWHRKLEEKADRDPRLKGRGEDLAKLFRVSQVQLLERAEFVKAKESIIADKGWMIVSQADTFLITKAEGEKCPRCWFYRTDIDSETHLCGRCNRVVTELERRKK
jgi:isoleucyl-tRNA synthetase